MKRFLALVTIALAAALGTPSVHAEILIGASGPVTGSIAWFGEQMQQGMDRKIAELNAAGGVLGEQVRALDGRRLLRCRAGDCRRQETRGGSLTAVIGHLCSGASIPASKIYAEAGILMVSPNPATRR